MSAKSLGCLLGFVGQDDALRLTPMLITVEPRLFIHNTHPVKIKMKNTRTLQKGNMFRIFLTTTTTTNHYNLPTYLLPTTYYPRPCERKEQNPSRERDDPPATDYPKRRETETQGSENRRIRYSQVRSEEPKPARSDQKLKSTKKRGTQERFRRETEFLHIRRLRRQLIFLLYRHMSHESHESAIPYLATYHPLEAGCNCYETLTANGWYESLLVALSQNAD